MWEAALDMQQMAPKKPVKALTLFVETSIHITNALRNKSNDSWFIMILFSFSWCLLLLYRMVPKATEAPARFQIHHNALPAVARADQALGLKKKKN